MTKLNRKRSSKAGLPAETLVYTGERKDEKITVHIIDYNEKNFAETQAASVDECIAFKNKATVTWINVDGVHDPLLLEKLGGCFGLHRLVIEDILNTDQRPKLEEYGEYLYLVVKMITNGTNDHLVTEQISLVLGQNFVLSLQEGIKGDAFDVIRERLRSGKGKIRKMGADYLVYALLDAVVDNYFVILEKLGDRIESLETELIENPQQQTVQRIYRLKRELIFLHNAVWPLREVVSALVKQEAPFIRETTAPYLRDVHDHVIHVLDSVDIYREMISGMLDMYLSSVSNRLNQVMKVLTVIATIFMPLTFIVGLYGMNFKHMPELDWRYGYPLVLVVMLVIAGFMMLWFKRKKWL